MAHDHDAAHHFAFAVQFCDTAPHIRSQGAHEACRAPESACLCRRPTAIMLDIFNRFNVAAPADHVFRAAQFDGTAADIVIAHADRVDDALHRQTVGCQRVRIEIDLILTHKAADARNFRHAFDATDLIAQVPILKAAQLRQIMFADSSTSAY